MTHLAYFVALATLVFASTQAAGQDLSSPRAALKTLESAYTNKNLDAAIAAHDFHIEAEVMLERIAVQQKWPSPPDADMIAKTAEVLELSFRKQINTTGFPKFSELQCSVSEEKPLQENIVMLVEKCRYPDGQDSVQKLYFALRDKKWRTFNVPTR